MKTYLDRGDGYSSGKTALGHNTRSKPFISLIKAGVAGLLILIGAAMPAWAQGTPPGCSGSGLGIGLYTDVGDVHVGDTVRYSVLVYNGVIGGPTACDATNIHAYIVLPNMVTNQITLVRTTLHNNEYDYYPNVASYVVQAGDILPDGTVQATARDVGAILQNDVPSVGGGFQGVNTMVSRPCIDFSINCTGGVGENGVFLISGTVTNCGNTTLVGVTVTNIDSSGTLVVSVLPNIPAFSSMSYTGVYYPHSPCTMTTVIGKATGADRFTTTPETRSATNQTTCGITLVAGIKVTKECPMNPTVPGEELYFSGSVSNTGNITLTNVVVINNQPVAGTEVLRLATLAVGGVASFTGHYTTPAACSVSDTLVASATSTCGQSVSDSASATCPIRTTPAIDVTLNCASTMLIPGGTAIYSGTVTNTGDITLTNVVIKVDHPSPDTVILTIPALAPKEGTVFQDTIVVPADVCSVSDSVKASGMGACSGTAVDDTASATCSVETLPALVVTLACPPSPVQAGGNLNFSGTVSNAGNVTVSNVIVTSDHAGVVATIASLAPGEVQSYNGSYAVPVDCSTTSSVTASGTSRCGAPVTSNTATTQCPINNSPMIAVTASCATNDVPPGGVYTYSAFVSNPGNIDLTNVVVTCDQTDGITVWGTNLLRAGVSVPFTGSFLVPRNVCSVTFNVSAVGTGLCGGTPVTAGSSRTCPITTTPSVAVGLECPASMVLNGDPITFTGTVTNTGNITLTNVVIARELPAPPTAVQTIATLAPGGTASFAVTFTSPANACSVTASVKATGNSICSGSAVSASRSRTCTLLTRPGIDVTMNCPSPAVAPGATLTYTATLRNSGDVALTNVVVSNSRTPSTPVLMVDTLAVGQTTNFSGSFTVPADICSVESTLTATANEICSGNQVAESDTKTCTLDTWAQIVVTPACPPLPVDAGGLLAFSGTVSNGGNITLSNVVIVSDHAGTVTTFAYLSPGAVQSFNGSYTVPADCSTTSRVTATALSACGQSVSDEKTLNCPIHNTPLIQVVGACPSTPVAPGQTLTYNGTVSNLGDIDLTNVTVVCDQTGAAVVYSTSLLPAHQSQSFSGTFAVAQNICSVTFKLTAAGTGLCGGSAVTDDDTQTCTLSTTPRVAVSLQCPPSPAVNGGPVTFTGEVVNTGNITLTNVVVVRDSPSPTTTVKTVALLAPGAAESFTFTFTAPANACEVSASVEASGKSFCTAATVTDRASKTCPLVTTPGVTITVACPPSPVVPGGVLNFSGSVSNSGDIALTNVVVVSSQVPGGPLLVVDNLAVGQVTNYSGYYLVPLGSCTAETPVTVTAGDVCQGRALTNSASATCTLSTTPLLTITYECPQYPCSAGGVCTFSGTVSNAGNVTLTNVMVANDHSVQPIFIAASFPPGSVATFSGVYLVPANAVCAITTTTTVSGYDQCVGTCIFASATRTCPLLSRSSIEVTAICPTTPIVQGGVLTYTGIVRNTGNTILTNVVVLNNRPAANTPVFSKAVLIPGEAASFTGSYATPDNCCVVWNTLTASGSDTCLGNPVTDTDTAICTVQTTPSLVVTKDCPATAALPGTPIRYSGTVSNAGNIALVQVTVTTGQGGLTPVLGPITMAPGETVRYNATYLPQDDVCTWTDVVTAKGLDACSLSQVTASLQKECPVITSPAIRVTKDCPASPTPKGGVYTFSGQVINTGNVTLTNVMVVCSEPTNNTPVSGPYTLAPGASTNYTGSYTAPTCCCLIIDTVTASGQDRCTGESVRATASAVCPLLTTPGIGVSITCPAVPVAPGGYYAYSGVVTNTGDVALTDVYVYCDQPTSGTLVLGPIDLAPHETAPFTGGYIVTACCAPVTNVVSVVGMDICQDRVVTARAACFGTQRVLIGGNGAPAPTFVNGVFKLSFATELGTIYTVQYQDVTGSGWSNLTAVPGTGGIITVTDTAPNKTSRLYRVVNPQ